MSAWAFWKWLLLGDLRQPKFCTKCGDPLVEHHGVETERHSFNARTGVRRVEKVPARTYLVCSRPNVFHDFWGWNPWCLSWENHG